MDLASDLLADYVDRPTLARGLRCSERTLARYEGQPNGLPSTTIAGRKYYKVARVMDWLAKREQRPNPRRA